MEQIQFEYLLFSFIQTFQQTNLEFIKPCPSSIFDVPNSIGFSDGFRGVHKGRTHPLNFEQQNFFNAIGINDLAGPDLLPVCIVDLSPS